MKKSFFKQLIMSALFACSLSADVPDVREQADGAVEGGGQTTQDAWQATDLSRVARDGGRQTTACPQTPWRRRDDGWCSAWHGADAKLCDGYVLSMPVRPSAFSAVTTPDPMALVLSAVWPLDGFGIHPLDRACIQWDVLPSVSPEAMNVPRDTLDAAFLIPRYRMPLALQESVWPAFADLPAPAEAGFATFLRPPERASRPSYAHRSGLREGGRREAGALRADMDDMIPRLKKIFTKEGVPQQWVWVAEVESALNPQAKSSAGAVGLFQLMPGTARRFGLQTTPVDDRMEPEKSAGAAAQYLKFLHREFGCWSLALAAYNAGEGRVKEIMKKRKAQTFNEVAPYLPSETRAYVPKVMAIVALREDQIHGIPGAYWMP
ncbi:MAG: lytic transglycosylase domain-containing protein [Verrucomicrobiota bacterium]